MVVPDQLNSPETYAAFLAKVATYQNKLAKLSGRGDDLQAP
jgi:hypothetical protein